MASDIKLVFHSSTIVKNMFSAYKIGSRKQLAVFVTLPYPLRLGPICSVVLTKFLTVLIIVPMHATRLIYLVFIESIVGRVV
jgi:hypothetical protein